LNMDDCQFFIRHVYSQIIPPNNKMEENVSSTGGQTDENR